MHPLLPPRRARTALYATTLLLASACADQPVEPRVAPPESAALNKIVQTASVTDFGAIPHDGVDDSPAFQRAVNTAREVVVPAGDWNIATVVNVPSNTRIRGVGAASRLVASTPGMYAMLDAVGPGDTPVYDVAVDSLGFLGTSEPWKHAFRTRWGQRIRFADNVAVRVGIINVDNSSEVEVIRNTGSDRVAEGHHGIDLNFARNVQVIANHVTDYGIGIQWWGGWADPAHPGFSRAKLTGGHTIANNLVHRTGGGIWGANGEHIVVSGNDVLGCSDVCLDAEGSDNVRFVGNWARYAGTAVLATFFYSTNVVFENNTVEQDGRRWGSHEAAGHLEQPWRTMFWQFGRHDDPGDISVELRNNRFTYTPTGGGVGLMLKESSRSLTIADNTMTNTALDLNYNNGGTVSVLRNKMSFSYGIDRPAILVGSNHMGPNYSAQGQAVVTGNTITSSVSQGSYFTLTPAIRVRQWAWSPLIVESTISDNNLSGARYYWHVEYRNDNAAHRWSISNNGGRIRRTGNTTPFLYFTPS